jgi:hypothetical protein
LLLAGIDCRSRGNLLANRRAVGRWLPTCRGRIGHIENDFYLLTPPEIVPCFFAEDKFLRMFLFFLIFFRTRQFSGEFLLNATNNRVFIDRTQNL